MVNEKVKKWLDGKGFGDRLFPVWLDISMKRFEYVHPAGGNEYMSVKLTPDELENASDAVGWCDVCKGWEEDG